MPKKRSIAKGHSKALQRLYARVGTGPSLPPEPEAPRDPPAHATEASNPILTADDNARLNAAIQKRARRAARRLNLIG